MMPTSSFRQGAIYLNNLGCTLLEYGAFEDAMETFQDAVFVMKNGLYHPPTSTVSGTGPVNNLDLPERFHRANRRLAFPRPCKLLSSRRNKVPPFAILTLEDYCQFEFESIMVNTLQVLMCPVRVETQDNDDVQYSDSDLDASTMLLNLGLAYACLARCYEEEHQQELQASACRIFQMADSILHHSQSNPCDNEEEDEMDDEQWKRTACVNMAVLHSLLQILVIQQVKDEPMSDNVTDPVMDRLYYLQNSVQRASEYDLPYDPSTCHAAAA